VEDGVIEFTKVSRTLFRKSKKFRQQNDDGRLLYLYLLVTEHINSAGCYQLSEGYAVTDLGWDDDRFLKAMDTLCKGGLIAWDREAETVLIEGWVTFNEPSNARHAIGILTQLHDVDSESLKARRFAEISASIHSKKLCNERVVGVDLAAKIAGFAYPLDTVPPPKNETKNETKKEIENKTEIKTETETREEVSRQPRPVAALKGDGPSAERLLRTNIMRRTA
jgi:hypothetical protein